MVSLYETDLAESRNYKTKARGQSLGPPLVLYNDFYAKKHFIFWNSYILKGHIKTTKKPPPNFLVSKVQNIQYSLSAPLGKKALDLRDIHIDLW